MTCWVEAVPNFSEGRRAEVVDELQRVAQSVAGVYLLGRTMDPDHHRAVLTLAGPRDAMAEAAFLLAESALRQLDLSQHCGVHPRLGVLDVLPFVPLLGADMEDCVQLAGSVGERIGRELEIPVFLYEQAARQADRRNLAVVRRGGLAGLRQRMAEQPEWKPDFGPATPHATAGAVAVGARFFLVAFNVCLNSRDLGLARSIARAIRQRDGGLPGVKALGLPLAAQDAVQVSMNLVDYRQTSMLTVYRRIERLAKEAGVSTRESELIGLAPAAALDAEVAQQIRLPNFDPMSQVLERRLESLQQGA